MAPLANLGRLILMHGIRLVPRPPTVNSVNNRPFASFSSLSKLRNHSEQKRIVIRLYTNMFHKYDREQKKMNWPLALYSSFILVCFVGSILNWRWVAEYLTFLPAKEFSMEEEFDRKYYDELVYIYGAHQLPECMKPPGYKPRGYMREVEAAERSASDSHSQIASPKRGLVEPNPENIAITGEADDGKKGGFRDRKITEYENRIRAYSTPDKVFRLFATLKIHDLDGDGFGIYMTPDDFVRAITPGMRQPEGLGLDHFRTFDPVKDKLQSDIPKDSIFHKLGENGLISFSDYLFLMTVLAISARHVEIAFKIFDVNGDGIVDSEEFDEILNVLRQQTSIGMRHREAKVTGSSYQGSPIVNSGLKAFFFGKNGKGKLNVHEFLGFQARIKDEVLQMEFKRMEPKDGKISEKEFAKMLLTYAGISEQKQKRMIKRVRQRFQGDTSKGIDFQQVESFSQVFRHLNDIDTALGLYHVAGGSIDQSTLKRVVKTVAKADLDDHVVDVVFTLFDDNEDGRLSQREFISIMKARQMRGLERPKDLGVTRLLSSIWKCAKEELQGKNAA